MTCGRKTEREAEGRRGQNPGRKASPTHPQGSLGASETITRSQLASLLKKEISNLRMYLFPHVFVMAEERESGSGCGKKKNTL